VPIIFQEICDGCDQYSTSSATLSQFLDFLAADTNVVVKTMHDALREGAPQPLDTTAPASTIACNSAACSTNWYAGSVQVSLAATDAQSGVAAIYYTTDGSELTNTSTAYSAPFPVSTSTTVVRADVAGTRGGQSKFVKDDSVAFATTVATRRCSNGWYTDWRCRWSRSTPVAHQGDPLHDQRFGADAEHALHSPILAPTTTVVPLDRRAGRGADAVTGRRSTPLPRPTSRKNGPAPTVGTTTRWSVVAAADTGSP
jgi:hypothetical protein